MNGDYIKKLKVGTITLDNNLILAPLAGYSDVVFRKLARQFGAGLTVTEMISAAGITHGNRHTLEMLILDESEKPSCVQLFGSDPKVFYQAAKAEEIAQFDIIDINMGCPVRKIVKSGEGSALLSDLPRAADIIRACKEGGKRPVSVKFRLGRTRKELNAVEFAVRAQDAGADMLTVHGRTAEQMYAGTADWSFIKAVKEAVKIPVVGNGDIDENSFEEKMRESGADGAMLGRGAIGNPQIFARLKGSPVIEKKSEILLRHLSLMEEVFGAHYALVNMRKHLAYYLKGASFVRVLRGKLNAIGNLEELKMCLKDVNF